MGNDIGKGKFKMTPELALSKRIKDRGIIKDSIYYKGNDRDVNIYFNK